jgi:SAM-dependent methyltransferase
MSQSLQDFNRLHVKQFATAPANLRAQEILLALVSRDQKLLDVGCGGGYYTVQFRDASNQVFGIDITFEGVQATHRSGIPTSVASVEQGLPFPPDTFDAVTFIEVIEHVLRPDLALRAIHRVLRPGGALILTTPNYAYWVLRILLLAGVPPVGLQARPFRGFRSRLPAPGVEAWLDPHIRFFSPRIMRRLLDQSGFEVVQLRSTFVSFPSGLAPYLPWLLGLPLRVIGKLIGNLDFLGDRFPSLLAAGMMIKAIKR